MFSMADYCLYKMPPRIDVSKGDTEHQSEYRANRMLFCWRWGEFGFDILSLICYTFDVGIGRQHGFFSRSSTYAPHPHSANNKRGATGSPLAICARRVPLALIGRSRSEKTDPAWRMLFDGPCSQLEARVAETESPMPPANADSPMAIVTVVSPSHQICLTIRWIFSRRIQRASSQRICDISSGRFGCGDGTGRSG